MRPDEASWYVAAFRADYLAVYRHRDLESARREADYLIARGVSGTVLDLCCGYGRHVLALRERGVAAFGLDLSAELLRESRGLPGAAELAGRLVRADARAVPILDARADAVVSLFSSFGYFEEREDREVLSAVARVLRRGGRLVLDLMNPARVRSRLVPASESSRDGLRIEERRSLAEGGRRVEKAVLLTSPDGRQRSWRESVRLYEPAEIDALLGAGGFEVERRDGGFEGEPYSPGAPRQIVHARRL